MALGELEGHFPRPHFGSNAVQLVIEGIAKSLGDGERENEVLVFRRVLCPVDGAREVPNPGFKGFVFFGFGLLGGGFG